jgi:hypothetical protein
MQVRAFGLTIALLAPLAAPCTALAGSGLVAPDASSLWPLWQARIAVQTATVSPLSRIHPLDGPTPQRAWQGGSVLGDYNFATPGFGTFRASGGLMVGGVGGAPLMAAAAGPRLGLSLQTGGQATVPGADTPGAVPYLGFGFTGATWRQTLSITADLGWVAERPGAAGQVGRALFGNQGMDSALRDLRVSPVLQLGMRYTF